MYYVIKNKSLGDQQCTIAENIMMVVKEIGKVFLGKTIYGNTMFSWGILPKSRRLNRVIIIKTKTLEDMMVMLSFLNVMISPGLPTVSLE